MFDGTPEDPLRFGTNAKVDTFADATMLCHDRALVPLTPVPARFARSVIVMALALAALIATDYKRDVWISFLFSFLLRLVCPLVAGRYGIEATRG